MSTNGLIRNVLLTYANENHDISEEINLHIEMEEQLKKAIIDEGEDLFEEEFEQEIWDALYSYKSTSRGSFNIDYESRMLRVDASQIISDTFGQEYVDAVERDENGKVINELRIELSDFLKGVIEHRLNEETSKIIVGQIVENSLNEYVAKSFWHYGLIHGDEILENENAWPHCYLSGSTPLWRANGKYYDPAIWFSPTGKEPISPWKIRPDVKEKELKFWGDDEEITMEAILNQENDPSDFIENYISGCGRECPNMRKIREICPINVTVNSKPDEIQTELYQFFVAHSQVEETKHIHVKIFLNYENYRVEQEYDTELTDSDELRDEIYNRVISELEPELDEYISKSLYHYIPEFSGTIDVDQTIENLFDDAYNYADTFFPGVNIHVLTENDTGSVVSEYDIPLSDCFKSWLQAYEDDGDARMAYGSYAISAGIEEYLKNSYWHYGLIADEIIIEENENRPEYKIIENKPRWMINSREFIPAIWYAPSDVIPATPWIIKPGEFSEFWLESDSDYIMQFVLYGLCVDSLLCWYIEACGCEVPATDLILQDCPIHIDDSSTEESVREDIYKFFKEQYPADQTIIVHINNEYDLKFDELPIQKGSQKRCKGTINGLDCVIYRADSTKTVMNYLLKTYPLADRWFSDLKEYAQFHIECFEEHKKAISFECIIGGKRHKMIALLSGPLWKDADKDFSNLREKIQYSFGIMESGNLFMEPVVNKNMGEIPGDVITSNNMIRENYLDYFHSIKFTAYPTVQTMDMGLEYICFSDEGKYSCLGMIGDWPASRLKYITGDQWNVIHTKVISETLQVEDLKGTSLENIWEYYARYHKDGKIQDFFSTLKNLPDEINGTVYLLCDLLDWEPEPEFFETDEEMAEAFQEKYMSFTDETWDDMDDDNLKYWYDQLQEQGTGLLIIDVEPETDD